MIDLEIKRPKYDQENLDLIIRLMQDCQSGYDNSL